MAYKGNTNWHNDRTEYLARQEALRQAVIHANGSISYCTAKEIATNADTFYAFLADRTVTEREVEHDGAPS